MKTFIFIILKILEIALIPLGYMVLCFVGHLVQPILQAAGIVGGYFNITYFLVGSLPFLVICLIWAIIMLLLLIIPDWIESNKVWSEKIYNKIKRK